MMIDAFGTWGPVSGPTIHRFIPIPLIRVHGLKFPHFPAAILDPFKAAHLRDVVAACGYRIAQRTGRPVWSRAVAEEQCLVDRKVSTHT